MLSVFLYLNQKSLDQLKLCIAEKPSVGKEIAKILGANSRRDGYFEGNGYFVSWTFGHLCTLKTPDDYTKAWKWWKINTLPMIPPSFGIKVIDDSGIQKQFNTIKTLIDKSEEVINCGDAGIEGEVIQRWVLHKAQCKIPVKRLWISSLTDEAIKEGFANLMDGDDFNLLYSAGNARAIGDWLLGMNATRLYTLKYANNKGVLSIGRVQTPTLALIVNRQKEIDGFISKPFWELKTKYREVLFNSTKGRFLVKEDAEKIVESIKDKEFEIVSFEKKKGKELPPNLFDLTALQVECNKSLGFTADETLKIIQSLYEKKLVTYPRVDTSYLPNDMYPKIKGIIEKLKPYAQFTEGILSQKIKKSKKVFNDKKVTDHHAIIPTGEYPQALRMEEKQVYDSITRRFIANFHDECIISNTTVIGQVVEYEFKATGKIILEPGWRVLYPKKKEDQNSNEAQIMPVFEKGEKGEHLPDLQEKQTNPPKQYSEATLLRAMETAGKQVEEEELQDLMKENGIGRPSTRANIIETLFKRKYIIRKRKNLVPTLTGIQLIDNIKVDILKSVELTGQWEKKLRQIENGEYEAKQFIDEMKVMLTELVQQVKSESAQSIHIEEDKKEKAKSETQTKDKSDSSSDTKKKKTTKAKVDQADLICPKCKKGKIIKGKSAYGCAEYKSGCHFKIDFTFLEKKLSENQIFSLIEKGKTTNIKGFLENGEKINGKLILDTEQNIQIEKTESKPKTEEKLICPKCGKGQIIKGKTAYGCDQFKAGCHFVIPFEILKKDFGTVLLNSKILKQLV